MSREEILKWAADHRMFHLAPVEGDQPRVRVFGSAVVIDGKVYFTMGKGKDVYNQLVANPKTEMCSDDAEEGRQVRVSGVALLVDDSAVWSEAFGQMPFIKSLADRRGLENMALFRVGQAKAVVWTRETSSMPKQYVDLCRSIRGLLEELTWLASSD